MSQKTLVRWAGGGLPQKRISDKVLRIVLDVYRGGRFIDPFVGEGAVLFSLLDLSPAKVSFSEFIVSDADKHLIQLYKALQLYGRCFVKQLETLFCEETNNAEAYYEFRERFNTSQKLNVLERSAIFFYLNHHSFNGLRLYNDEGEFVTPFGLRVNPLETFKSLNLVEKAKQLQKVSFKVRNHTEVFAKGLYPKDLLFCSLPPANAAATSKPIARHQGASLGQLDHEVVGEGIRKARSKSVRVVLLIQDDPGLKKIYTGLGLKIKYMELIKSRRALSFTGGGGAEHRELLLVF